MKACNAINPCVLTNFASINAFSAAFLYLAVIDCLVPPMLSLISSSIILVEAAKYIEDSSAPVALSTPSGISGFSVMRAISFWAVGLV